MGIRMSNVKQQTMREKFIAYLQVQQEGNYNMFSPLAHNAVEELCGETVSLEDYVHMMRNYTELYNQYISE
jgi:hypothetical protein